MTLTNIRTFPPKGYVYREATIPWVNPDPMNGEGIVAAARLLQIARAQNPWANLDPSLEACLDAVAMYTCARLKSHYPYEVWSQFCEDANGPPISQSAKPYTGCGGGCG